MPFFQRKRSLTDSTPTQPRKGTHHRVLRRRNSGGSFLLLQRRKKAAPKKATPVESLKQIDLLDPKPEYVIAALSHFLLQKMHVDRQLAVPLVGPNNSQLFDERLHPIDRAPSLAQPALPSIIEISNYIFKFSRIGDLAPVALVLTMLYLEKLLAKCPQLGLSQHLWKCVVTACMVLACKVYEDQGVYLTDFAHETHFPFLTNRHLCRLEATLLKLLAYEIEWNVTDYTRIILNLNDRLRPALDAFKKTFSSPQDN